MQEAQLIIYDIHFIYYGVPPTTVLTRSTLSANQPKNGEGDQRECSVSACEDSGNSAGDPIDTLTGNFSYSLVDLSLETVAGPLSLQRSYASQALDSSLYSSSMAPGWTHNQDIRLILSGDTVWFKGHTLNQYQFTENSDGSYSPYAGVTASLQQNADLSYTLTTSDQSVYSFDSEGYLQTWRNVHGFGFNYTYTNNLLTQVTEPLSGRYLQFVYTNDRLTSVIDNSGRQISFGYDANDDLTSFTDASNNSWGYEYTNHLLEVLTSPETAPNNVVLHTDYDAEGRAYEQFDGENRRITHITFNSDGTRTITDALGRTTTQGYDARNTNTMIESTTGFKTYKAYDDNFRPESVTDDDGNSMSMTWSSDGANLASITDKGNFTTSMTYNANNQLTQVTDPYDVKTVLSYSDTLLQNVTRRDASDNTLSITSFTYTTSSDAPQPEGLLKTTTDALGNVTEYTYDTAGQLQTVTQVNTGGSNVVTQVTYDDLGRITDITGPTGIVTHYIYDALDNLLSVTENYDSGRSVNEDNIWNRVTSYSYTVLGQLDTVTNALNVQIANYDYNKAGDIVSEYDALNHQTSYTFTNAGELATVTLSNNYKIRYNYDSTTGFLEELYEVDSANQENLLESYTYHSNGNLETETVNLPDGETDYTIHYAYNAIQQVTHSWDNDNHDLTFTYDAYGNSLTQTDTIAGITTKYEYNDFYLLEAVVENYIAGGASDHETNVLTEYGYNALGFLTTVTNARNYTTTYQYNDLNQLWQVIDPLLHTTTYSYDLLGNPVSVQDANGNTISYGYDDAGRLDVIDYPGGSPEDVTVEYDPLSRVTDMVDELGQTHWTYNNLDQITNVTDPYNRSLGYTYNSLGQRETLTYPGGRTVTTSYDWRSLPYQVLDSTTLLATYNFDSAQRLESVQRGNGDTSQYTYSPGGNLLSLSHTNGEDFLASYAYQYDSAGNRTQAIESYLLPFEPTLTPTATLTSTVTATGTETATLTLTPTATATTAGTSTPTETSAATQTPDSTATSTPSFTPTPSVTSGSAPSETPVSTSSATAAYTQTPTPTFTTTTTETSAAATNTPTLTQTPESMGNLSTDEGRGKTSFIKKTWDFLTAFVSKRPLADPVRPADQQEYQNVPWTADEIEQVEINYGYDKLNRLTSAVYNSGASYAYGYDAAGNRVSQTVNGVNTISVYDAANRLVEAGGVTFSWDNNGNLLSDGLFTYTYNYANQLSSLTDGTNSYGFTYDGLGNRYEQSINGVSTQYTLDIAAGLTQVLSDGSNTYFGGLGFSNSSGMQYYLGDALGSVRQICDEMGELLLTQSFDPYGGILEQEGSTQSIFGYTGEQTDSSGLVYLRARYYSTEQGRFITEDPYPGIASLPSSQYPYSYALNNPIVHTDPSGEYVPLISALAGGGFVAGAVVNILHQTNGLRDFCHFDVMEMLAWGVGGAFAGVSLALLSVELLSFAGLGLQGIALYLFPYAGTTGIAATISGMSTGLWILGTGTLGASSVWATKLFSDIQKSNYPPIKRGASGGPTASKQFSDSVKKEVNDQNPQKICVYCRMEGTATQVDHAIPKSVGGNATIENAQLVCPHCNQSKGNRQFPLTPPPGFSGKWPPSWW